MFYHIKILLILLNNFFIIITTEVRPINTSNDLCLFIYFF